ncbi:DEAD/DEAH box helicase [Haloquadratum walsbyi]|jgi:Superfamily II DNA/RNA helicases, SNF2 family|uniref:Superfamily II DNA/RNA helicase, SNF2 family n=1 Tax=Haloquadratum walsbyi J07HQW2 TaxID=1238425 RepID=U1PNA5_9EURY|nr:SNF2-related protein [Haloquadratum walsbyi]ERG95227.1 MAG: superfamily II DNA/RNA helicase, SNF2 family [Haloquadratum walsbyi J07HQW2]
MATDDEPLVDTTVKLEDSSSILDKVGNSGGEELSSHLLNIEANRLSIAQSQQELQSLQEITDQVQLLEHQLDAAHRALFQMNGKALFADEVGLGKTIEVGMVLKEMVFREAHDTFLILTPAQLATQWQSEMDEKFGLDFACNYDDDFEGFDLANKIVASIDTAKQDSYAKEIHQRSWDALIIDEAHYLRNQDTNRYEFVDDIEYRYAFFATATPIQNDVTDIYNIINLIRPGLFGTKTEFERRYLPNGDSGGVQGASDLNRQLQSVMIRHKRGDTEIDFTDRDVKTRSFEPSHKERSLYDAVTDYVKTHYSKRAGQHLVMLMLQKEVVSSPWAVLSTVEKWLDGDGRNVTGRERNKLLSIAKQARQIEQTTKQEKLLEIIRSVNRRMDTGRTIVFTQFRATQSAIVDALHAGAGGDDVPVHSVSGSLSSGQKDEQIQHFKKRGGVLVTTDSISEGRNIQFCNVIINYDLPWNPMSVEQRIGRIDRIGQDRDVYVYNLALEGTIEDYVLEKLYGKIDVFHQTVGGLKEILSEREQSSGQFEQEVLQQLIDAGSEQELENNFEDMAVDLKEDEQTAKKAQQFNEQVFDGFETGNNKA